VPSEVPGAASLEGLQKVKSIIRDMMHKVEIQREEAELLFKDVRGH
jgi:hypothetical protein